LKRRDFLKIGGAAFAQAGTATLLPAQAAQMPMASANDNTKADYTGTAC
jgi:hypothetical protein